VEVAVGVYISGHASTRHGTRGSTRKNAFFELGPCASGVLVPKKGTLV
jgi:hypothetical protein